MEMRTPEHKKQCTERTRSISDLPDDIGHTILSFLPVEIVAQTGFLSKRWRSLWHSFPTLDFTTIYQNRLNHQNQGIPFDSLISSVLLNRQQGSNIKLFRLKGSVSSPFLSICLDNLVSIHQIEELDLEVALSDPCAIAYKLLSCKSLRALTLKSEIFDAHFILSTPYLIDSLDLKSLHTLSLTCVYFTNGLSIHNHFTESTFPVLKRLCLRDCKGISSHVISCPSLELLEINNLDIKGLGVFCKGLKVLKVLGCFRISPEVQRWVEIIAPKLQEIHWSDNPSTEICWMGRFPNLRLWRINFPDEDPSHVVLRCRATLLSTPSFTRHLQLGLSDISHMAEIDSEGIRLHTFENLTYLYLVSGLNKCDLPGVASILRCCPRLRKLKVDVLNLVKNGPDVSIKNNYLSQYNLSLSSGNYNRSVRISERLIY